MSRKVSLLEAVSMVIEFWPHLRSVETDLTSFIGMKKELGFESAALR